MRLLSTVRCSAVAAALLASCSGNGSSPSSATPGAAMMPQARHYDLPLATAPKSLVLYAQFHGIEAPQSARRGIYVEEYDYFPMEKNIIGYPRNNRSDGPPICSFSTGGEVNGIATDGKGNLIVPNGFSGVNVYKGPKMCGRLLGTITDSSGQASDAAAIDAVNGTIVVGNIGGEVKNCTLASLNCTTLTSPNMGASGTVLAGVAMDKAGNCYADALNTSGAANLWYYTGCTGTGRQLGPSDGFSEPYYGGLSVDNHGNLVVISLFDASFSTPSTVTVYSGCSTGKCAVVGGPFNLQGESIFGGLGRQNTRYVAPNLSTAQIDIYSYTGYGTGLTYLYSFDNGLDCASDFCESAVYSPSSPK